MHTIGYTDAEVSITPTTNYAEFNALVPQITIANNVSGYMKELRFTIAEIMLDKLARILGGQDIQSTTGAQQTFTQFWSEADFESLCVVYHGDPQGRRRLKLIGYVNDNSLLVEQGTVSGNTFTPASSGADITSQFTIDMINGEFYLTPVNQNQLVQLSGSNTHVRLTYNYMTLTMKDLGLIDNVNKLLKYFAFVILGRNDNAGDGRWLVFYIPRAQISAMPTP
ncbi:MAG: hypothetical protein NZ839_00560, partial [Endomicrobia bacterium]|nr:hypothetical protein [Endomicrobiia bacterium]